MTNGTKVTLATAIALVIGHFLYQVWPGGWDWSLALDRSYFSCFAIGCLWFGVRREFRRAEEARD